MWDLLKEYLEKNENCIYSNVKVIDYNINDHNCKIKFRELNSESNKTITISIWDVMVYVNEKKSIKIN